MTTVIPTRPRPRSLRDVRLRALERASGTVFLPDHPGWVRFKAAPDEWYRLSAGRHGGQVLTSLGLATQGLKPRPSFMTLPAMVEEILPATLYQRLASHNVVVRIGTPTVWEAAATAVLRQVVHRDQARRLFDRVCETLGALMLVEGEAHYAFPSASKVASTAEDALRATGLGFKAKTLKTLARWCLNTEQAWMPDELFSALIALRGIGAWTAGVTVCDVFSDFDYYPVDDLAVRTHVGRQWSNHSWPRNPAHFAGQWRAATAPYTGIITAFLLADAVLSETRVKVRPPD